MENVMEKYKKKLEESAELRRLVKVCAFTISFGLAISLSGYEIDSRRPECLPRGQERFS